MIFCKQIPITLPLDTMNPILHPIFTDYLPSFHELVFKIALTYEKNSSAKNRKISIPHWELTIMTTKSHGKCAFCLQSLMLHHYTNVITVVLSHS